MKEEIACEFPERLIVVAVPGLVSRSQTIYYVIQSPDIFDGDLLHI